MDFNAKLDLALEAATPADRAGAEWAKRSPEDVEVGRIGNRTFTGEKDRVKIRFDPTDIKTAGEYLEHTHPVPEGVESSFMTVLPSEEDVRVAIDNNDKGIAGLIIYSSDGKYELKLTATDKLREDANLNAYMNAFKSLLRQQVSGTEEDVRGPLQELERLGFEAETIDHT